MDISATKLELIEMLLNTKKDFVLEKIRTILLNEKEDIRDVSKINKPISLDDYNNKLQKAENDFIDGKIISHQDLKKKFNIANE